MTLQEAINFFESLTKLTTSKSEIKIYEKFIQVLSELKNREFPKDEAQYIEDKLDSLNLESYPENVNKYLKYSVSNFVYYLLV